MGNEITESKISLPQKEKEIDMNEPKSPEFYFNKSIFPNLEKSNIKILFQESLTNDAKKQKNKTFS